MRHISGILARYLSWTVIKYYALFSVIAVTAASMIQFLENRDGLMDRPSLTILDAIQFSVLNAPGIFSLLAGFIALISVLVACVTLARYSELKVMLAAGLTYGQFVCALLPAAIALAAFHFAIENVALPRATIALHDWDAGTPGKPNPADAIWLRQGNYILSAHSLRESDHSLTDVELFALDASGSMVWHLAGPTARFEIGGIIFPQAVRVTAGEARPHMQRNFRFATTLDFDTVATLALHPKQISAWKIGRVLARTTAGAYPRYVYDLWFHRKVAGPVTTALIVLLLAPLVQYVHRIGTVPLVLGGLAMAFVYFVVDAVLAGLGEAGVVAPQIAAWGMAGVLLACIMAMRFPAGPLTEPAVTPP